MMNAFANYLARVLGSHLFAAWTIVWCSAGVVIVESPSLTAAETARLTLNPHDSVCLVGNALGERLQFHNEWESLLHKRHADLELSVRNLCFPGDEPYQRERSLNFGSPDDHLGYSKASVVIYFFGYNESFAGEAGLAKFTRDIKSILRETLEKDFGKGPVRVALVSPIAAEATGDPLLPDATILNRQLRLYRDAMAKVAKELDVPFADVLTPTERMFDEATERLTINGVHLNDEGYARFAPILDEALFGQQNTPNIDERLVTEIDDKNFHWFHRYRAVNGYSIWGKRGSAGSDGTYNNTDVMQREREILSQMASIRDARIWKLAQGESVTESPDDSTTLPFIEPKTNVGIPNDPNRKGGKLGSLEYYPAAEQQKMFKLQEGFVVELVASEEQFPELANPVALNFDSQGRLWVATMPSYPQWKPKTEMDDKLIILEDVDGDGRSDTCKVFAGGLHQPTGFEIGMGGAYVAMQPDVLFLEDTDGDDRADRRTRVLTGFDTADSHHGIAAFEWGPGGGLHFMEGTFKESQVESAWGARRLHNSGVWRYEPRTEKVEAHVSYALSNPWGLVFDPFGQGFLADASPGHNYWITPISGDVIFPDKHPGGSRAKALDRPGSRSNANFPTFMQKRIRPSAGCEFVSSSNFPPESQGNYLQNNVIGELAVLQHTVRESESGFEGKEIETLLKCDDGNFRPVDLQFGPDGALYIVDWHNALVGHLQHNLREPNRDHSHGRIWRVYYKDRPLVTPPKIAGETIENLLNLLDEPEDRTRYRVRRELAARDSAEVAQVLDAWLPKLSSNQDPLRLEALWVYQSHHVVREELLKELLEANDHRIRAAAVRVLSAWKDRIANSLFLTAVATADEHPRVRLEGVRACSFYDSPNAIEVALLAAEQPLDTYLRYTLDETVRVLQEKCAAAAHLASDSHQHGGSSSPGPIVFFDVPETVVNYQLERLSPAELLKVKRDPSDPKCRPLYEKLLAVDGLAYSDRREALRALQKQSELSSTELLLQELEKNHASDASLSPAAVDMIRLLGEQPIDELKTHAAELAKRAEAGRGAVARGAVVTLLRLNEAEQVRGIAEKNLRSRASVLDALCLPCVEQPPTWTTTFAISSLSNEMPVGVRTAAIQALAINAGDDANAFAKLATLVDDEKVGPIAISSMLRMEAKSNVDFDVEPVVETLVRLGEKTPVRDRSLEPFINKMQLVDVLMPGVAESKRAKFRARVRKIAIRVVPIATVEEEMRYDTPYFAVEAGSDVQIVLNNRDLMPHNLVIAKPGKLREVAYAGMEVGIAGGKSRKQYVPDGDDVLFATDMVAAGTEVRLTFKAPTEPGEYPYVCTFPQHWMRMYGVMVVVKDLDAWLVAPTKPADPIGSNRAFVAAWTEQDFSGLADDPLTSHSAAIGEKIFQEATCALCHKFAGQGAAIGPDLTDVYDRWKGDSAMILREIIDPSACVEEKFAATMILDVDGRSITGIVIAEDEETVTLMDNPESKRPTVIAKDDIELRQLSSVSLMPKGLMDRFTKNEILDLLAYLKLGAKQP